VRHIQSARKKKYQVLLEDIAAESKANRVHLTDTAKPFQAAMPCLGKGWVLTGNDVTSKVGCLVSTAMGNAEKNTKTCYPYPPIITEEIT
jgi:hypothetical protein